MPETEELQFPTWFNAQKFKEGVAAVYSYFNLRVQRDGEFVDVTQEELLSSDLFSLTLENVEMQGRFTQELSSFRQVVKAIHVVLLESIGPTSDTENLPLKEKIGKIRAVLFALFPGDLMVYILDDIESVSSSYPNWFDIVKFHHELIQIFKDYDLQVQRQEKFVQATLSMYLLASHPYRLKAEDDQFEEVNPNTTEFNPFIERVKNALLQSMVDFQKSPPKKEILMSRLRDLGDPIGFTYPADLISNTLTIIHNRIWQEVSKSQSPQSS